MEKFRLIFVLLITFTAMGIVAHAFKSDFENSLGNFEEFNESNRNYLLREKRANKKRGSNRRNNQKKNSNRDREYSSNKDRGGEESEREGREPPKQRR